MGCVGGAAAVCVCPTGIDIPTDKEDCKFLLNIRRLGSAGPWVGVCPTGRDIPTDKENCKFLAVQCRAVGGSVFD